MPFLTRPEAIVTGAGRYGRDRSHIALYGVVYSAVVLVVLVRLGTAAVVNWASLSTLPRDHEYVSTHEHTKTLESLEISLRGIVFMFPSAPVYRKLGQVYLMLGKKDQAEDILSQGATHYPYDFILALELGDTLASLGDRQRAIQQWRRAGVSAGYLGLNGLTYHAPGEQIDPRSRLETAADMWPESSNSWFEIGRIYMNRNAGREAAAAFNKAIILDRWTQQADLYVSKLFAHYYLGLILYNHNDWEGAYRNFQAYSDLVEAKHTATNDPYMPILHKMMGIAKHAQGVPVEAARHFSRALELGARDGDTYFFLSLAERDQKQYEQAISHLLTAIAMEGGTPEYYRLLAQLYVAVGNKQNAIDALNQALKLSPEDPTIKKDLADLQSR